MFFFSRFFNMGYNPVQYITTNWLDQVSLDLERKIFFVFFFHDTNKYWKWNISNFDSTLQWGKRFRGSYWIAMPGSYCVLHQTAMPSIFWLTICEICHRILIFLRNEQNSQLTFIIFVFLAWLDWWVTILVETKNLTKNSIIFSIFSLVD